MKTFIKEFLAIDSTKFDLNFTLDTIKNVIACAVLISGGIYLYDTSDKERIYGIFLFVAGGFLVLACLGRFYWVMLATHMKYRKTDPEDESKNEGISGDLVGMLVFISTIAIYKFFKFMISRYLGG